MKWCHSHLPSFILNICNCVQVQGKEAWAGAQVSDQPQADSSEMANKAGRDEEEEGEAMEDPEDAYLFELTDDQLLGLVDMDEARTERRTDGSV